MSTTYAPHYKFLRFVFALVLLLQVTLQSKGNQFDVNELDYEIWDLMDQTVVHFGEGLSWYEILSVEEETATINDIQKSFRKLSLLYHPDKATSDASSEAKFAILSSAVKILKDDEGRMKYDYYLKNGIPYFRNLGRRVFRRSENLSILQSLTVVMGFVLCAEYFIRVLTYYRIKSGIILLPRLRNEFQAVKKSKKNRRESSKDDLNNPENYGIFDDANMKMAIDYLIYTLNMDPEVVLDRVKWSRFMSQSYETEENLIKQELKFPVFLKDSFITSCCRRSHQHVHDMDKDDETNLKKD
jgi:hypothetical protein